MRTLEQTKADLNIAVQKRDALVLVKAVLDRMRAFGTLHRRIGDLMEQSIWAKGADAVPLSEEVAELCQQLAIEHRFLNTAIAELRAHPMGATVWADMNASIAAKARS